MSDIQSQYHFRNNFFETPKSYNGVMLFQIGELMCDANAKCDDHIHGNFYEITYVFSGKGKIYTNDKCANVTKGDLYFSHPQEKHRIESNDAEPLRYFFIAFNVNHDSPLQSILDQSRMLSNDEKKRVYRTNSVLSHFQHLLSEINEKAAFYEMVIEYELKTVILKTLRLIITHESIAYQHMTSNHNQLLCFNIINYIDNHFLNIDNATSLSGIFGYNYTYLSRFFKKKTGETISSYILNKKLEMAKQMLETSNVSITEIANELKYSSIHVLTRAFKKKYHITPTAYRMLAKAKRP